MMLVANVKVPVCLGLQCKASTEDTTAAGCLVRQDGPGQHTVGTD